MIERRVEGGSALLFDAIDGGLDILP